MYGEFVKTKKKANRRWGERKSLTICHCIGGGGGGGGGGGVEKEIGLENMHHTLIHEPRSSDNVWAKKTHFDTK